MDRRQLIEDIKDLIAEAREWPRDGVNEGRLINGLADALEAEHQRAEAYRTMQRETAKAARGIVAERDALHTAIQDALRELWAVPMSATEEARHILSRAIDTKEKPMNPREKLIEDAAFDPPTALALIAELRLARECIEKVRAEADAYGRQPDVMEPCGAVAQSLRFILTEYDKQKDNVQGEPSDAQEEDLEERVDRALVALMHDPEVPTGVRPHLLGGEVLVIRERTDAEPIVRAVLRAAAETGGEHHDRDRMGICRRCGSGISAAELLDGEQPCVPDRTIGTEEEPK